VSKLSKKFDENRALARSFINQFKNGIFTEYSPLRKLSLKIHHLEKLSIRRKPKFYLPVPKDTFAAKGTSKRLAFPKRTFPFTLRLREQKDLPRKGNLTVSLFFPKSQKELRENIKQGLYPLPHGWSLEHEKILRNIVPLFYLMMYPWIRFFCLNKHCPILETPWGTTVRAVFMEEVFNRKSERLIEVNFIPQWVLNKTQLKLLDLPEFYNSMAGIPSKSNRPLDNYYTSVRIKDPVDAIDTRRFIPETPPVVKVIREKKEKAPKRKKVRPAHFPPKRGKDEPMTRSLAVNIIKGKLPNETGYPLDYIKWRSKQQ